MKPYKEQTYYELLELEPSASMDEIRAAYERAIRLYDSDSVALYPLGDPEQVEELKKLLLEAMEILTDEDLRVEYDRSLGITTAYPASPPPPVPGVEAAKAALEAPPGPSEIDARAAAARKEADVHVQVQAHVSRAADEPPAPEALPLPGAEERAAPASAPESRVEGTPPAAEVDARAEESRAASDHAAEAKLHAAAPGHPEPPEPSQLVMDEVVSRAETRHSTAPRYQISYLPRVPAPVREAPAPEAATAHPTRAPSRGEPSGRESPPAPGERSASAPPAPPVPTPTPAPEPAAPKPARALEQAQLIAQESAIAAAESELAKVSAHVAQRTREQPRQRMEIPEDAVYNGELLRQVREHRGLTLQQLAERTRISSRHLENVEADRYDALPATVYLRGILMSMSRELGLDALRAARSYLALVDRERGKNYKP